MTIQVKVINKGDQPLPSYETAHSAGLDLRAALAEEVVLAPASAASFPRAYSSKSPRATRHRSGRAAAWLSSAA